MRGTDLRLLKRGFVWPWRDARDTDHLPHFLCEILKQTVVIERYIQNIACRASTRLPITTTKFLKTPNLFRPVW